MKQTPRFDREATRQSSQAVQGNISLRSLNGSDVRAMEASRSSKLLLAQTTLPAEPPEVASNHLS